MERNNMPLASLLVAFYNQEKFVEDTVKGALAQTYANLEIVFSDDCSTDGTFQAIKDAVKDYNGPHKIILNRNEPNMSLVPHVNKELFELSHGEFIFLNGGDDVSLPKRVEQGVDYFIKYKEVTAVTFSRITIDKYGNEKSRDMVNSDIIQSISDSDYLLSAGFMTRGVGLSFRRNLLNIFGPLSNDCQTEDSTLRFRAMLGGKTLTSAEYGLKYRIHDNNMSRNIYKLSTEPIANQYRKDLELVKETLSPQLYDIVSKKIDYYIAYRNLQSKAFSTSFIKRQLIKIKCFLLRKQFERVVLDFKK